MVPTHILVADDEWSIRSFVSEVLEDAGYLVQAVGDGASALAAIHQAPPALVLLDIAMPVMTGDETLHRLRTEGYTLPIVVMTAGTQPERFLALRATAVLPKPFSIDALLTVVTKALWSA